MTLFYYMIDSVDLKRLSPRYCNHRHVRVVQGAWDMRKSFLRRAHASASGCARAEVMTLCMIASECRSAGIRCMPCCRV